MCILALFLLSTSLASAAASASAGNPSCHHYPADGTGSAFHYICTPRQGAARNELLLFFGGSGSSPDRNGLAFINHAQGLGFHVFSVLYPNSPAMGSTCAGKAPACFEQERLARLYGGMRWNTSVIAKEDGGINRFVKAMLELPSQHPNAGFDIFLDPKQQDGIAWNKIVSAGHSQGAGMSPLVAKYRLLLGVVGLSGVDDVIYPDGLDADAAPAPWILKPGLTPAERFFGLGHKRGFACFTWTINWPALNMSGWSEAGATQLQGQMLCGTANSTVTTNYHGVTISDPMFKPAWTYMLLRGLAPSLFESEEDSVSLEKCVCTPDSPPPEIIV